MNIIVNPCNYFVPKSTTTSATICANCGLEKWQHALPNLQPMDNAKQEYGKIKKFAMTQEEILEGNKLINAFMGYPYNMTKNGYPEQVIYHSSWDWLMPVVERIFKMYEWDKFYYNPTMAYFYLSAKIKIYTGSKDNDFGTCGDMEYKYIKCDNNPLYVAVIEFIKWHKTPTK